MIVTADIVIALPEGRMIACPLQAQNTCSVPFSMGLAWTVLVWQCTKRDKAQG